MNVEQILFTCTDSMKDEMVRRAKSEHVSLSDFVRKNLALHFGFDEPVSFRKPRKIKPKPEKKSGSQKVAEIVDFLAKNNGVSVVQIAKHFNRSPDWVRYMLKRVENLKVFDKKPFGIGTPVKFYGFFTDEEIESKIEKNELEIQEKRNARDELNRQRKQKAWKRKRSKRYSEMHEIDVCGTKLNVSISSVYRKKKWVVRAVTVFRGRKYREYERESDCNVIQDLLERLTLSISNGEMNHVYR